MQKNFGTPEQLKEAVEERIAELGGAEIESATNTGSIGTAPASVVLDGQAQSEDMNASESVAVDGEPIRGTEDEGYFIQLEEGVKDKVGDLTWQKRDDKITISIPYEDGIHVVDVPFSDLSLSADGLSHDVDYIVSYLKDELGFGAADINSAYDQDAFYENDVQYDAWEEVARKEVPDADGFMTEYVMYKNKDEDVWIFMFGDPDVYPPDPDYADWSSDGEIAAWEWFDSYTGFDEDDDDDDDYEDWE